MAIAALLGDNAAQDGGVIIRPADDEVVTPAIGLVTASLEPTPAHGGTHEMGCLYQRGKTWWIKYSRNGRPYFESSHSKKKEEAKRLLRLREGDIARGVPVTSRIGRMRFEEAAEDFLTDYQINKRKSYADVKRRIVIGLAPWFQHRRMTQITTADVQHYVQARQAGGAANATINRELAALKRMYTLAIKGRKLLYRPHIPMLAENNVRQGFFERAQFDAVRAELSDALRGVATLAYYTGWRVRSEVLSLTWPQIDRREGTIRLEPGTTKSKAGRTVAYLEIDELREAIEVQWQWHLELRSEGTICPWVFSHTTPAKKWGQRIKTFRRSWLGACQRAGVPGRVLHDFRRTAVRNLERAGVPRKVAMAMVGHKTESIYRRYDIVTESDLHAAAARLNARQETPSLAVTKS